MSRHPKRRLKIQYVTVYAVTREYGGPEEGGWWYNHYEPIVCTRVLPKKVEVVTKQMEAEWCPCSHGNIYSMAGGEEYVVYVEDKPEESATKEQPYYC